MRKYIYAIGFRTAKHPRKIKYLKTRETNAQRAIKALRDMLRGNKYYTGGVVDKIRLINGVEAEIITTVKELP